MAKQKQRARPGAVPDAEYGERQDWREEGGGGHDFSDSPGQNEPWGKSRSQKKRESTALQHRGQELASLSPAVLSKLPLSPELAEALALWRGLKTHEAKRRHMQYIGRLMREQDDPEALLSALDEVNAEASRDAGRFTHLEHLRDALLDPSESCRAAALERVMDELPDREHSRIVHLVEAALADRDKKRPPKHARALFRYLRDGQEG